MLWICHPRRGASSLWLLLSLIRHSALLWDLQHGCEDFCGQVECRPHCCCCCFIFSSSCSCSILSALCDIVWVLLVCGTVCRCGSFQIDSLFPENWRALFFLYLFFALSPSLSCTDGRRDVGEVVGWIFQSMLCFHFTLTFIAAHHLFLFCRKTLPQVEAFSIFNVKPYIFVDNNNIRSC